MTTRTTVAVSSVRPRVQRSVRHVTVWIGALLFSMLAWMVAIRVVATFVR